jgi:hypothetical protein
MSSQSDYIEELESALLDIMGSTYDVGIHCLSGCSKERCKEIENLCKTVRENYCKKHNIKD